MLKNLFLAAFAGISAVGAVNYQPPSQDSILQILCPDAATLQFKLNADNAAVYAAYVASQKMPATLFFANNATVATTSQCSPPQSFAAFQVNAAGSLASDGTTYTITNFVQLPAADAVAAAHKEMEQALIPSEDAMFQNLQDVYNGASKTGMDDDFTKSLQIPDGYMEALWAMGNLTQALTSGSQHLSVRGAPLAVGFLSATVPMLVFLSILYTTIQITSKKATFTQGGSKSVKQLTYPSTYQVPWFVMGGGGGDDGSGTETCTVATPPGFADPDTSIDIPSSGPCSVFIRDLKFKRAAADWNFNRALQTVGTDFGFSEAAGTLVLSCKASDLWPATKAFTGKISKFIIKTNTDDPASPANPADDKEPDEDCDPFADLVENALGDIFVPKVVPYLNLELKASYDVFGAGEVNIDFVVHFPGSAASWSNIDVVTDGNNPSKNTAIVTTPLQPSSDVCMEINRFAATVGSLKVGVDLTLGMGVKTIVKKKEVLDVGITTGPSLKFTGTNFKIDAKGGGSAGNTTSSTSSASFSVATVRARKVGKARRDHAAMYDEIETRANVQGCTEELTIKGGYETNAIVKIGGKDAVNNKIEEYTNVPIKTSGIAMCAAPWVVNL